jgi:hypothetical protein
MGVFRVALLLANGAVFVWILGLIIEHPPGRAEWIVYAVLSCFLVDEI